MPATSTRRVGATAAVTVVLLGCLSTACGAGVPGSSDCPAFTESVAERDRGLSISPGTAAPGDSVEVSRADGSRTDYATAVLHSDGEAGCRTYALVVDSGGGDGGDWEDVTDVEEYTTHAFVSTDVLAARFPVPDVAGAGRYVLCVDEGPAQLCGLFQVG